MALYDHFVKTSASPWPNTATLPVFLLDANNSLEEKLLASWVEHHRPAGINAHQIILRLGDDRKPLQPVGLSNLLGGASDALVIPLRVAWTPSDKAYLSGPRLRHLIQGPERRPGSLRGRRTLKRHPERVHLIQGAPDTVSSMGERFCKKYEITPEQRPEEFAVFVARQAAIVLDNAERRLQGGRYKVPRYIAQSLRNNQEFKRRLYDIANQTERSRSDVMKEVNEYFKEMISIPTSFWLDLWIKFCNVCLGLGYEPRLNYSPEDLERVRTMVRNHPSALLWTHKTYIDGFVVPKLLFDNNFPVPHFFAGANLNIPLLGALVQRAGGIFIKRSFNDNEVYKATLRQYVGYLMEKRFPLTWSFEGTRSRLGKLMPPKYGVLKYVLEGCYNTGAQDIHIIPVTVSYDLIRDAEEYAREQSGVPKAPESLGWLVGYLRSLARPMGKIYVDFGEPVILPTAPEPEDRLALSKVAFQVAVEANRVTPITYPAVVSMVLLGVYPRALTEAEVAADVDEIVQWARDRNLRMSPDFDRQYAEGTEKLLSLMIAEGLVARFTGGPATVYGIETGQASVASYYRNTIVHFFINRAIIELSLTAVAEAESGETNLLDLFWAEVLEMRDIFKFEFFYPPTDEFRLEIVEEMQRVDIQWEQLLEEGPSGARSLLAAMKLQVAHLSLQMFAEAYSLGADLLANLTENETIDEEDFIDRCMNYGRQSLLQRRISSEASMLKLLFKNCWSTLSARELTNHSLPDYMTARSRQAEALNALIRRIEIRRASAIARRGNSTLRDKARGGL